VAAPTLVGGWVFNGTTQYLDTGIVWTNDQTWSFIVRWKDIAVGADNLSLAGTYNTVGGSFLININTTPDPDTHTFYNGSNRNVVSTTETSGILAVAGVYGYFNGLVESLAIAASPGANALSMFIGCCNADGAPYFGDPQGSTILALAIYNTPLSAPQVAAVTAAMALL
jgi:hypothetical protein